MAAAPLSATVPGDSLLYSFTPGSANRGGGGAVASPPPIASPRRMRTQSVTGDLTRRPDSGDHATDLQVSPRSTSILHLPGRPSNSGGGSGATAAGGGASILGRSGSADRHSYSSGSGMPHLVSGTGGSACANGLRHSIGSGGGLVGLPRLDILPGGLGLAAAQDAPLTSRGPPSGAGRRGSVSGGGFGGGGGGGALCESSLSLSASLDNPFAGIDVNAALSPRHGGPAILAPLRSPLLPGGSGGSGGHSASGGAAAGGSAAPPPAALLLEGPAASGPNQGWCGTSGAGGSFAPLGSGRRSSLSGVLEAPLPVAGLPSGPLSAFGDFTGSGPAPPPLTTRRSSSLTAHASAGQPDDGPASGGSAIAVAGTALRSTGSAGGLGSAGSSADYTACHPGSTAIDLLSSINDDLQRAAGALLALHAPACRPRSAAPNAPPPPPPPVTAAQLAALRASAPELHSELRVAVRRAFQVMRQALAAGGGGAAAAALGGRQLGSCVHECWATLDAFLEGTAELTMSLVEGALASKSSAGGAGSLGRSKSRGGGAVSPDGEEEEDGGRAGGVSAAAAAADGGDSSSRGGESPRRGNNLFKLHDAMQELDHLRAANQDLRRQLEDSRARLAAAEAEGAADADGSVSGGVRGAAATGPLPRPPGPHAAPPGDACCGSSPRRGKHARMQPPQRKDDHGADGGPSGTGSARGGERHTRSDPGENGGGGGGGAGGSGEPPRLFDRVAGLARGSGSRKEMVIEAEDSEGGEGEAEEEDAGVSGSPLPRGQQALRVMLTTHSASFAEWMRGGRRR